MISANLRVIIMLVYGKNVLFDLNPKKIRKVSLVENKKNNEILNYLKEHGIRFEFIPLERMNRLVDGNHQGVILEINDYDYYELSSVYESDFVLILDHLEDPHNLGANIRTAEASGIEYIILPKDRSVRVNETVMKTSVGALDRVKIVLVTNIAQSIKSLQEHGFFVYATDMVGTDYRKLDYDTKKALVIGSEGNGVSSLVKKASDEIITIPMNGKVNSLNASVAAGILIFQMKGER